MPKLEPEPQSRLHMSCRNSTTSTITCCIPGYTLVGRQNESRTEIWTRAPQFEKGATQECLKYWAKLPSHGTKLLLSLWGLGSLYSLLLLQSSCWWESLFLSQVAHLLPLACFITYTHTSLCSLFTYVLDIEFSDFSGKVLSTCTSMSPFLNYSYLYLQYFGYL